MTKPSTTSPLGRPLVTKPSIDSTKPEMQSALFKLAQHAETVIAEERERDWLPLMRNKAAELEIDLDVKDGELEAYLQAAERRINPATVYKGGDVLQASEPSFLLNGLIQLGETNLIVNNDMKGSACSVTFQLTEVKCFLDDSLTGKSGISVDEDRHHLLATLIFAMILFAT